MCLLYFVEKIFDGKGKPILMSDTASKLVSTPDDNSNYFDSDESVDGMESDHEPIQLFGRKCESWDDICVVLKECSDLWDKFLFLYRIYGKVFFSLISLS